MSLRPIYVGTSLCVLLLAGCGSQEPPKAAAPTSTVSDAIVSGPPTKIQSKTGVEMVLIPAGQFMMGDDAGEDDEKPAHRVELSAFYIDAAEVTQASFQAIMGRNPSKSVAPEKPVERVSWVAAVQYCNMRSSREGFKPCYDLKTFQCDFTADGYRLPTEAEWEYACRAGTTSRWSFGDIAAELAKYGWFKGNAGGTTHAVRQQSPNAWGLYDMHGNVAEWCNDYYGEHYDAGAPAKAPRGPAAGDERVLRGGSWNSDGESCRCGARHSEPPGFADVCFGYEAYGFRCVRAAGSAEPPQQDPAMLFHTWPFLLFMLVVLPVLFALGRTRFWIVWLMAASYFFYSWWNPYYLLLVVYSTTLDYLLVMLMDHCPPAGQIRAGPADPVLKRAFLISAVLAIGLFGGAAAGPATLRPTCLAFAVLVLLMALGAGLRSRRIWLWISVVNNLALLLFFKYARFVVENLNQVLAWTGTSLHLADPSTVMPYGFTYVLPVGISFFTFQSMSYTIDFYLGKVARERNFFRFATFVCFFPQLMAGPIERAKHMLPQFRQGPALRLQNLADGGSLFLVGLFKKLALADYLAQYVDQIYGHPHQFAAPALVLATFAFAWQIFFDFSGYTDMARGLARMMGFNLILNFNNPYLATGLGDFWSRWHISLSTWFRDYVYIPLGGNRHGTLSTYRNLFITFLVSGVWHGANWTFAIWGMLHGLGVMLSRELERSAFYRDRVPAVVKQAWVFAYVSFAWIFFRAASLPDALLVIRRIGGATWSDPAVPVLMLLLVAAVWLYQFMYESRLRGVLGTAGVRVTLAAAMFLYLCLCTSSGGTFIYFQF